MAQAAPARARATSEVPGPGEVVARAHELERAVLDALGLTREEVIELAPKRTRGTPTRWALVLGLAEAVRRVRGVPAPEQVVRALSAYHEAEELYWQLALRTRGLAARHWRWLGDDPKSGAQEGLIWLHKAARLYDPERGTSWRRYARLWLTSQKFRHQWMIHTRHGLEVLARIEQDGGRRGRSDAVLAADLSLSPTVVRDALAHQPALRSTEGRWSGNGASNGCYSNKDAYTIEKPSHDPHPEHALRVAELVSRLAPRVAYVLIRRFGLFGARAVGVGVVVEVASPGRELSCHKLVDVLREVSPRDPVRCDPVQVAWVARLDDGATVDELAGLAGLSVGRVVACVVAMREAMGHRGTEVAPHEVDCEAPLPVTEIAVRPEPVVEDLVVVARRTGQGVIGHFARTLDLALSTEELLARAAVLADIERRIRAQVQQQRERGRAMRARMRRLVLDRTRLAEIVRTGHEVRAVEVCVVADFDAGTASEVAPDGRVLLTRALHGLERQVQLFAAEAP